MPLPEQFPLLPLALLLAFEEALQVEMFALSFRILGFFFFVDLLLDELSGFEFLISSYADYFFL